MNNPTDIPTGIKRKRARAILAGGLVLGLGAAMTLAAWTDQVHVFGEFSTGDGKAQFQGNVTTDQDEAEWHDYHGGPGGAGELAFSVPVQAMSPDDVVYAPVGLRTVTDSTSFTVDLEGATRSAGSEGLFDGLRYRVRTGVAPSVCNSTAFAPGSVVGTEVPLAGASEQWAPLGGGTVDPFTLAAATESLPGATTSLCFAVRIDPERIDPDVPSDLDFMSDLQDSSVTASWTFSGTTATT